MGRSVRENRVKDGPSCRGCGLANYEGLCPHCRGDQDAYERELVPPFESSIEPERDTAAPPWWVGWGA